MPNPPDIAVVLERPGFVIIDKPPGMLSVPGRGDDKQDCAVARVRAHFPRARGPMVVHRLDMETSGLLIVALDEAHQRALSGLFERREVRKRYVGVVTGDVRTDAGEVNLALRLDPARRPLQVHDPRRGREAVTRWRVLERVPGEGSSGGARTRLEFEPVTGRSHQIRVHCAHPLGLNAPLVGDALYGERGGEARMLLHAGGLRFVEPASGEVIEAVSDAGF